MSQVDAICTTHVTSLRHTTLELYREGHDGILTHLCGGLSNRSLIYAD